MIKYFTKYHFEYKSVLSYKILMFTLWAIAVNLFPAHGRVINAASEKVISQDLLFERFYTYNGLPDNRIRSIFQDSRGFLWIGTMNGVSRYDGYYFKKYYETKKSNSISGNWAYAICEDGGKNIWIGTKEGLNKFDVKKDGFESFVNERNNPNSIVSNIINTLQFDQKGRLWIGTPKGLNRFDPVTRTFTRFNTYPFNTNICKIIKSYGDYIWIATRDGAVHYNVQNGKYQFFKIVVKPNAFGDRFWSMMEENKDLYLTTGGDGLMRLPFDKATNSYKRYEYLNDFKGGNLSKIEVFDICKSKQGDIWLGTTGLGLAKIEKINTPFKKITFYRNNTLNDQSISNDQVFKVFIDKTDVLWCGTEHGLNKLDLHLLPFHYFTFIDKKDKDQVRSIASNDGKIIWFGTSKSGLYKYNILNGVSKNSRVPESRSFFNLNRSLLITDNAIWNGSLGGALKTDFQLNGYTHEIDGQAVFAFLKDSKKNVWVGTNNGLYKITPDGKRVNYLDDVSKLDAMRSAFVRAIYEDHKGNIWIGFENSAVAYFNPNTGIFTFIKQNKNGDKVFGNIVYSIVEYPKNVIWVGSESGLNRIILSKNGDYFIKNYFEENGLPDKSVNGIISDDKGNLWISTTKGLVKFDVRKESFQTYLNNISFTFSCYYKVNNQCFLFGSTDGFVVFNPDAITIDANVPEVIISDFKLFNKSVDINEKFNGDVILKQPAYNTEHITLGYYNNQFTIEFTALHFSNPNNNFYAYKMVGFNRDWIYTNSFNRSATYTNLDAGTYTFMVKSSNYSGKWNENPKTIEITILPPPWRTWWAIIIYIILIIGIIYIVLRYILIQSKQRQQIHFEQKEKEQLRNLNQMKVKFFTDVSHEFRTPLSLIIGPVEDILSTEELNAGLKSKVQLIYRNCKKLLYLIDELMTFQKMEQGKLKLKSLNLDIVDFVRDVYENFLPLSVNKGIQFNLIHEVDHCVTSFDPGKMEMVINNLLFNAFKFSNQNGVVTVRIATLERGQVQVNGDTKTGDWACISIEDNGKGISSEEFNHLFERFFSETNIKGTGVGLSLTKNLVELHNGAITVESNPGVKTIFKVFIPLQINDAVTEDSFQYTSSYDISMLVDEKVKQNSDVAELVQDDEQQILLVVDDNPEVLDYLEMIFSNKYQVIKAENGLKALEILKKVLPDLVISDLMMPGMDGIELCEKVKTDINISHIPFILLTAKSNIESRIKGLQTGADDYIAKPFHPDVLKLRVNKLIETQRRLIAKFKVDGGVIIPKNIAHNPLDEKFLQKIIDCINANMGNDEFSVEEMGNVVAMSRSNLFRKLKAIIGQTPIEFIYYIRLKHAMELLLERKMNISEIAYEVGFKNPSSFSKSFKKLFGKSPSDFLGDILKNKEN